MAAPEQEAPVRLQIDEALGVLQSLGMTAMGTEALQSYVLSIETDAGRLQAVRALGDLGLAKMRQGVPNQLLRYYQSPFDQFLNRLVPDAEAREQFTSLDSTDRNALAIHLATVFSLSPLQRQRLQAMAVTTSYNEAERVSGSTRQQLGSAKNNILQKIQMLCVQDETLLSRTLRQFIDERETNLRGADIPPVLIRKELQRLLRERAGKTGSRIRAIYGHLIGEGGISAEAIMRPAGLLRKSIERYGRLQREKMLEGMTASPPNEEEMLVLSTLLGKPANGIAPGSYRQIIQFYMKRGRIVTSEQIRMMAARALARLPTD